MVKRMNCKLEKFWNVFPLLIICLSLIMNCKLEKFWNCFAFFSWIAYVTMNCKLEKFWNFLVFGGIDIYDKWTVNLKSFEISDGHISINKTVNEL